MSRPTVTRTAGVAGLATGLALALASNLTATWPHGPVMIGTGLAAPLVLPLVLWVRSTFQAVNLWERLVRELSVVAVAGPAAALSYWHTINLMTGHGIPGWLASVLPLSADGVATISTLALHRATAKTRKVESPKLKPAKTPEPAARPAPSAQVRQITEKPNGRDRMVTWLRSRDPARAVDEVRALITEFGVSESTAKRVRRHAGRVAS